MKFESDLLNECWFLAGPTACGKSEVGMSLAEHLAAEIISLDSMCLYRGMDIGTAKPTADARRLVNHHLIDLLEPHEEFSVAEYVEAARQVCLAILSRRRTPLFVGGTALYLRAILRGVFDGPPADWAYRRELESAAAGQPGYLHRLLGEVDAESARRLHPHDERRLVRALEVHKLTGVPLSKQQQQPPLPPEKRPRNVFWLCPPRHWLHRRIEDRVEAMFANGLLDEVRRLLAGEQPLGRTAAQALGYKEMIAHLRGGPSRCETIALIQNRTRQFAKRQYTWFRNLIECVPIHTTGGESSTDVANRILAHVHDVRPAEN